ncbi:MAG: hypothetical protein PQJ50_15300 [Spirochaetales bacterium]|nr:hypothetical protein [Spirochaetales bacterium]
MHKFNSAALLAERADLFRNYFGQGRKESNSKISFPSSGENCYLSYTGRKSLISRNYYLTLGADFSTESAAPDSGGSCYFSRLGTWRVKGKDTRLTALCASLNSNRDLSLQLKKTDIESVTVDTRNEQLQLSINLYGGGFTSVMLPPMRVPIGIPPRQVQESAKLFHMIRKTVLEFT